MLYTDERGRVAIALAFNKAIRNDIVKVGLTLLSRFVIQRETISVSVTVTPPGFFLLRGQNTLGSPGKFSWTTPSTLAINATNFIGLHQDK